MAQASEMPSNVLVPRPTSSRMTRLRGVALFRMLAVSLISTMNVLWLRLRSSVAPTRANRRSTTPILARLAGTKLPTCAMIAISATWRIYVLLPAMLGPVIKRIEPGIAAQVNVVGHEIAGRQDRVEHGMAAGLDLEDRLGDDLRASSSRDGRPARRARPAHRAVPAPRLPGSAAVLRPRPGRASVVKSSYSSSQARSSARSTRSSCSLSSGVMYRSAFFTVCLRM